MVTVEQTWVRVTSYEELGKTNCLTVNVDGHVIVLFKYGENVFAVDNRCPHMGFPLNKGTVKDGILTCHWHHARFDLASGGTFDLWADDVPAFPVKVDGDDVLVNTALPQNQREKHQERVRVGLEQNLNLVLAKSVIGLQKYGEQMATPFTTAVDFGTQYRGNGWGQGLTILGCMMNLVPHLETQQQPRAMYHGLSAVASNTAQHTPHFSVGTIPNDAVDMTTLKRWLRQFVEVRDTQAVERVILSALEAGADDKIMADMLFASATDHRYIEVGHVLDFINKAFESLDITGWQLAPQVLTSLAPLLTNASRMEESNAWRSPIDLVEILHKAFEQMPSALATQQSTAPDFDALVPVLLDDNPQASVDVLLDALKNGVAPVDLAGIVTYVAAVRIAQFHTSNEFGDWDTALHTFTFANAVHMGLRRVNSNDLVRGIFDAAMSIYLDRFLNIPAAKIPQPTQSVDNPSTILDELRSLLNQQQQVNQAGEQIALYLHSGGDDNALIATMGELLLREDRDFHTIQCVEAAVRQYEILRGTQYAPVILVAAARYLAAHAPTMRAQGQTYQIASRLAHGEKLFEG